VVGELIEQGKLQPEEAQSHAAGGVITQYMGMEKQAQPHIKSFKLKKGDRLLLCSDGLTDMLTDVQIREILRRESNVNVAVDKLVFQANEAGGVDNITVVLIDY
jgi:protein phosphatase